MSEIKVDTVGPRVDNGTLTIGAAGDTVNIAGTAGTGFPAGTTINNNADNRVITGSGTSGTLNGEARLLYDGDVLTQQANGSTTEFRQTVDGAGTYWSSLIASASDVKLYTRTNSPLKFGINNATKWEIDTSGNLLPSSTSTGVYLGVSSATASHLLDAYEEGTFVPAWSVQGGGSLGTAPATNKGVYTKVGRSCTISIMSYILATTGTIASYTCTNLPFQSAPFSVAPAMGQEFGQTGYGMLCVNAQDDSTVVIKKYDGNGPPANAYMRVQFTYQTV
jgi:hypothetical protein